jgi:hypothetical protein
MPRMGQYRRVGIGEEILRFRAFKFLADDGLTGSDSGPEVGFRETTGGSGGSPRSPFLANFRLADNQEIDEIRVRSHLEMSYAE